MKSIFNLLLVMLFMSGSWSMFAQKAESEKNTKSDPTIPIFEIKNDAGQTVFAVYPGGVKIFIDDQLKAAGGGFTVGRLSTGKATGGDILTVSPGNVNVFLDPTLKAAGGGFTVGRLSTGKAFGDTINFLEVTPEKTHVNVDATSSGGFSVGKVGTVSVDNFLNVTPENYFIGHGIAPDITTGTKNSVIGYFAGHSLRTGHDNILFGDSAGYHLNGNESIFIGNSAGYSAISPVRNILIGHEAGYKNLDGQYNLYIGYQAGRNTTGEHNTILGGLAAANENVGNENVVIGYVAGYEMTGEKNVILGANAGKWNTGSGNVFIGYYSGENYALNAKNNILAIDARIGTNTAHVPLIYGEFDNRGIAINDIDLNGNTFWVNGLAGGTDNWSANSDRRLKTNVVSIDKALEKVIKLNGVQFNWKDKKVHSSKKQIGFIAQDIDKVVPEVVNKSGEYYTVQYAPLTALLVEAVKEQQKIIEKLENRISDLEKTNQELKADVSEIQGIKAQLDELKSLVKELSSVAVDKAEETAE